MLQQFTCADFQMCLGIDVAPAFTIKHFLAQPQQLTPAAEATVTGASTASSSG